MESRASIGRKNKLLLGLAGVACSLSLTGGAYGTKLSSKSVVQSADTAVVSLTVGDQSGAASFVAGISALYPDDANATDNTPTDAWDDRVVEITNTSEVVTNLRLAVTASSLDGGPDLTESMISDDIPEGLGVSVWRCRSGSSDTPVAYSQANADAAATCSGNEQLLLAESEVPLNSTQILASLPANTNVNLRIRIRLPEAATNTSQGDSASLGFTISLSQRTGGAI